MRHSIRFFVLMLAVAALLSAIACMPTDTPPALDVEVCTVIFDTGVSEHGDITVKVAKGEKTSGWSIPAPEGYYHDGWFREDGTRWDFSKDKVEEDITLHAGFTPLTFVVWFEIDGQPYASEEVSWRKTATEPGIPPEIPGMKFICWSYEGAPYDFSMPVTETLHLEAYFEPAESGEETENDQ